MSALPFACAISAPNAVLYWDYYTIKDDFMFFTLVYTPLYNYGSLASKKRRSSALSTPITI